MFLAAVLASLMQLTLIPPTESEPSRATPFLFLTLIRLDASVESVTIKSVDVSKKTTPSVYVDCRMISAALWKIWCTSDLLSSRLHGSC